MKARVVSALSVTAGFIKKARSRGFEGASIEELIRLADRGFNN